MTHRIEPQARPYVKASYARTAAHVRRISYMDRAMETRLAFLRSLRLKKRYGKKIEDAVMNSLSKDELDFVHGKGSDYSVPNMQIKVEDI